MKIRYSSRFEDFIEFSVFHHTTPKNLKKVMLRHVLIVVIFSVLIMGVLFFISHMKEDFYFIKFGLLLVPMIMVSQYYAYKKYPEKLRADLPRYLKNANRQDFAGDHEIEILDDGIIEKPSGEKTAWHDIREICSTDRYAFIYITETRAHVIPRGRVKKKAYDNFMKELEERRALNAAGQGKG